jgi:hypothetical protein
MDADEPATFGTLLAGIRFTVDSCRKICIPDETFVNGKFITISAGATN